MNANTMRKITNEAQETKRAKKIEKHRKYVEKLIGTKIHKMSLKGLTKATFKVKRGYSPTLAIEQFAEKGFDMTQSKMKNGKVLLIAKW